MTGERERKNPSLPLSIDSFPPGQLVESHGDDDDENDDDENDDDDDAAAFGR